MVAIPTAKKLYIDLQARALPGNFAALDRDTAKVAAAQRKIAAEAKAAASVQERGAVAVAKAQGQVAASAERSALTIQRAEERVTAARRQAMRLSLQYSQQMARGAEDAADRTQLAWRQAEARVTELAKAAADERVRQEQRVGVASRLAADEQIKQQARVRAAQSASSAQQAAAARAGGVARTGAIAGGLSMVGTGLIGAGAIGAVGGYELIKQGLNWSTFVAQNKANSPMSAAESKRFQALALSIARRDGANPQDVYMALRYGAEMGLSGPTDRRFLTSALALGLPTGGSAAVAPSLMALATVRKNFPQYANNPNAIGNMILSASQNSAGVSASQFVGAIPKLLNIAGHIGGQNQLPQSLALIAALTSAGMPLDEAQTQGTNMIVRLLKPSPATLKYIASLKKNTGVDVSGDFGPQALGQKGLLGVVNDLRSHNLGPQTLGYLFPNMRGYFGALGLTGNQNASFNNIYGRILQSPQTNPMATNLQNYLKLDSTQFKELQQQLHTTAIALGQGLLPVMNDMLRTYGPLIKDATSFVRQNKGLIKTFVEMSPWLIGAGVGFKVIAGGMRLILAAKGGDLLIQRFAVAMRGAGTAAEAATGVEAAGAAGTGVLGFGASLTELAAVGGPIALAIAAIGALGIALTPEHVPKGSPAPTTGHWLGKTWIPGAPAGGSTGSGGRLASAPAGWHPGMGLFGLRGSASSSAFSRPTQYWNGPKQPGDAWMLGANGQYGYFPGTSAAGGAAFHYDLPASKGQPFYLPGKGTKYTILAVAKHPPGDGDPGYVYTLQGPDGAIFTVGNVSTLPGPGAGMPAFRKGGTIYGGQYGGRVGAGAAGPHVHIAGNAAARSLFYSQSGGVRHLPQAGAGGGLFTSFDQSHFSQIGAWATKAKVPVEAALAVLGMESSGGTNKKAGVNVMQVTQPALDQLRKVGYKGVPAKVSDIKTPQESLYWGEMYLGYLLNGPAHGSMQLALQMYNGSGPLAVAYGKNAMGLYDQFLGLGLSSPGSSLNYAPPTGRGARASGRTNPQTPYQRSQWWQSRASGLSGTINQIAGLWPNANLSQPNAQQRGILTPLLGTYYRDQYQSQRSLIHSEYKSHPGLMREALAAAATELRHELHNPFAFFSSGTTASSRIAPVQVVGSNRQLGQAEAQNKHLKEIIDLLKKELANDRALIRVLQKSVGEQKKGNKPPKHSQTKHGGAEPIPAYP